AAEVGGRADVAEAVDAAEVRVRLGGEDAPQERLLELLRLVGGRLERGQLAADRPGHDLAEGFAQQPVEHGLSRGSIRGPVHFPEGTASETRPLLAPAGAPFPAVCSCAAGLPASGPPLTGSWSAAAAPPPRRRRDQPVSP